MPFQQHFGKHTTLFCLRAGHLRENRYFRMLTFEVCGTTLDIHWLINIAIFDRN